MNICDHTYAEALGAARQGAPPATLRQEGGDAPGSGAGAVLRDGAHRHGHGRGGEIGLDEWDEWDE